MASLCNFKVKYFEFLKLFSPVKLMQLCFKKTLGLICSFTHLYYAEMSMMWKFQVCSSK